MHRFPPLQGPQALWVAVTLLFSKISGSPICLPLWREIWVLPLIMCPCCSLQPMYLHVSEEAPTQGPICPLKLWFPHLFQPGLTAHYPGDFCLTKDTWRAWGRTWNIGQCCFFALGWGWNLLFSFFLLFNTYYWGKEMLP